MPTNPFTYVRNERPISPFNKYNITGRRECQRRRRTPSGGIYANGKPLFSAMTDAELFGEIAREADGGRLAELRSERESRTGQESADRRARSARLGEIEQMLSDVPRADDTELNMQERYLRRRAAQLDSEIEVARDSGDDVKGLTDELRRAQESLNAIHVEQQRRAQARREAEESLINEIRDANPGARRTDAQQGASG